MVNMSVEKISIKWISEKSNNDKYYLPLTALFPLAAESKLSHITILSPSQTSAVHLPFSAAGSAAAAVGYTGLTPGSAHAACADSCLVWFLWQPFQSEISAGCVPARRRWTSCSPAAVRVFASPQPLAPLCLPRPK